jgi:hypothetical protein
VRVSAGRCVWMWLSGYLAALSCRYDAISPLQIYGASGCARKDPMPHRAAGPNEQGGGSHGGGLRTSGAGVGVAVVTVRALAPTLNTVTPVRDLMWPRSQLRLVVILVARCRRRRSAHRCFRKRRSATSQRLCKNTGSRDPGGAGVSSHCAQSAFELAE